jgi:hypothetical protein
MVAIASRWKRERCRGGEVRWRRGGEVERRWRGGGEEVERWRGGEWWREGYV